jgi:glycosyltransferase involved in cell wall biosynthesis
MSERSFLVPTLTGVHSHPRRSGTASCRRFSWALSGSAGSERADLCFSTPPRSSGAWDTTSKSSFLALDPSLRPGSPSLRALGYVHKGREFQRFVEIVRSFHFGRLLSRVEAFGQSMLEYLRLGIPIITTAVGGIVDPKGAGLRFLVEADGERIAEALARFFESSRAMRR